MNIGNVVRLSKGHLVIITDINKDTIQWISLSSSNSSGITRNKSYERVETCYDCRDVEVDPDCELCKGEGAYKENIDGMDKATIEARSVKDFIISRTMKNFEF